MFARSDNAVWQEDRGACIAGKHRSHRDGAICRSCRRLRTWGGRQTAFAAVVTSDNAYRTLLFRTLRA